MTGRSQTRYWALRARIGGWKAHRHFEPGMTVAADHGAIARFDAGLYNCQTEADPARRTLPRVLEPMKRFGQGIQILFWNAVAVIRNR